MAPESPPGPPPPTPPGRDPTAPARLLDAAGEVGLRVERTQRRLDDLSATLERLAEQAGVTRGASG